MKWFKRLMYLINNYEKDIAFIEGKLEKTSHTANEAINKSVSARNLASEAREYIRERTEVSADIHLRGYSSIVVIGRYKNRDCVETFTMESDDFDYMVSILRDKTRFARKHRIDVVPECVAYIDHGIRAI